MRSVATPGVGQCRTGTSLPIVLLVVLSGCSGNSDGISVQGQLLLNGAPVAGEITFEPLGSDGAHGRASSVYADASGRFSATVPTVSAETHEQSCRIVIRVSPESGDGLPSAFDFSSLPEKSVELRRVLYHDMSLHFALTR